MRRGYAKAAAHCADAREALGVTWARDHECHMGSFRSGACVAEDFASGLCVVPSVGENRTMTLRISAAMRRHLVVMLVVAVASAVAWGTWGIYGWIAVTLAYGLSLLFRAE